MRVRWKFSEVESDVDLGDGIENFCQQTIAERDYGFRCFLARGGMSVEL